MSVELKSLVERPASRPSRSLAGRGRPALHQRLCRRVSLRYLCRCFLCFLLQMPSKLESHGGQQFVGKGPVSTRTEALVQRGGQHGTWSAFVDRGEDCPAAFAGVRDLSGELGEVWLLDQGARS